MRLSSFMPTTSIVVLEGQKSATETFLYRIKFTLCGRLFEVQHIKRTYPEISGCLTSAPSGCRTQTLVSSLERTVRHQKKRVLRCNNVDGMHSLGKVQSVSLPRKCWSAMANYALESNNNNNFSGRWLTIS